jgi:hypothetical protein
MGIPRKTSALHDPEKSMVCRTLHGFTNTISQADRSVANPEGLIPGFRAGIIVDSVQAAQARFSENVQLYMDSITF